MEQDVITVAIADDHPLATEGLEAMLSKIRNVKVVGIASNGEELIKVVLETKPQIVLTDVRMKVMDGIEATIAIKHHLPETRVLGISSFEEIPLVNDMMDAGAHGFLLKNVGIPELQKAFEAVLADEDFFSADIAHMLYNSKSPEFTEKEKQVMIQIAQEKTSREIAELLNISMRTVVKHRHSIERKIGVKSTVGIALFAMKNGYL